ncbi:hypothetical protein IMZ16_10295 [Cruoricaptor ignavus]|uniref:Uncharacterized protein n=1 Tax=Cruoricaptor ignavus TaxID=1118202 RepID=A0A7M1T4K3_9FLAO|nr:hypothetical protein [Cruoricaptor ignavus]QOR73873.1 hypothetical protein IMZ16_10295 [Cruoricaptor ignavus]
MKFGGQYKINKDVINPQHDFFNNNHTFNEFLSLLKLDEDILEGSTKSFFKYIYDEYKTSLLSNAGWQAPPQSLTLENNYDIDNYEYLIDCKVYSQRPFKMYYKIDVRKEMFHLFTRGSKIEMKYHQELPSIIDKLNTHEVFEVRDLLKPLEEEWPIEAGLYFLSMIFDKRGIEVIIKSNEVEPTEDRNQDILKEIE